MTTGRRVERLDFLTEEPIALSSHALTYVALNVVLDKGMLSDEDEDVAPPLAADRRKGGERKDTKIRPPVTLRSVVCGRSLCLLVHVCYFVYLPLLFVIGYC